MAIGCRSAASATKCACSPAAATTGAPATLRLPSPRPLLRARSFTLDGEAVVCGPDGVAIFDALHRRGTVTEAMLYAFDLLELDGDDLRSMPLGDRKNRLARLLRGRRLGIVLSDHTDDDGATIFRQACRMGLEGIVSKRLTAPYRSGPSKDWLKVKNLDGGRRSERARSNGRGRLGRDAGPSGWLGGPRRGPRCEKTDGPIIAKTAAGEIADGALFDSDRMAPKSSRYDSVCIQRRGPLRDDHLQRPAQDASPIGTLDRWANR
jgi:bifunctional non-homologous end joining protein LigD